MKNKIWNFFQLANIVLFPNHKQTSFSFNVPFSSFTFSKESHHEQVVHHNTISMNLRSKISNCRTLKKLQVIVWGFDELTICMFALTMRLTKSQWHRDFVEAPKCSFCQNHKDIVMLPHSPWFCLKLKSVAFAKITVTHCDSAKLTHNPNMWYKM